jgi:hypothetical protein
MHNSYSIFETVIRVHFDKINPQNHVRQAAGSSTRVDIRQEIVSVTDFGMKLGAFAVLGESCPRRVELTSSSILHSSVY